MSEHFSINFNPIRSISDAEMRGIKLLSTYFDLSFIDFLPILNSMLFLSVSVVLCLLCSSLVQGKPLLTFAAIPRGST